MKNWNVKVAGVTFKNPVIVSAGSPTINIHGMERCIAAGAGGICTKSISFQPFSWTYPRPHSLFLDKFGDPGSIVPLELGFWQPEQGVSYIEKIKPLAERENTRVIANIAVEEFETEKLRELAKRLQDSGADLIEACCPCPVLIPIETAETWYRENLVRVIEILKGAVTIPVYPKLFVDVLNQENIRRIEDAGADAVHLIPPPHGITVDIESGKPVIPIYGLYYNRGWRGTGSYWTYLVSKTAKVPVICSGGVFRGRDAIERIMLGASLVGICTAVIYFGYRRITKIIQEFDNFMEKKGYDDVNNILAVASPYVGDLQEFGRLIARRQVSREALTITIEEEKCSKCGRCTVCMYDAMTMETEGPKIDLTLCERCGVCESLCPTGAIVILESA